jgi:outer membrane protein
MKNLSTVLAALALLGVIVLFVLRGKDTKPASGSGSRRTTSSTVQGAAPSGRIAFVDIDSLEAHYDYFKSKKEEFTRRQAAIESELQRSGAQLQQQAADFQRKAQSGGFASQAEGEAAGRRIQQMEQSLETRRQTLASGLLKDQDAFNADLQKRLDAFLADYVKDKGYDYVLSYSKAGSILFANQSLNVTDDVIEGMNARLKEDNSK